MKGIILSQLFKIKRDKISIFTFFAILAVEALMLLMVFGTEPTTTPLMSGGEFAAMALSMFALLAQFFTYVFTAQTCGVDFTDKTCNYEIMAGHTRSQVFFGRAIPCIIISTLATLTLIGAPVAIYSAMQGWGNSLSFTDMLVRFLMLAFPIIRICCEYILLTYILKNPYIVMGISYVMAILLGSNIPPTQATSPVLGMTNMNLLTTVDSWAFYGLEGNINHTYETALNSGDIITTITVSLIVSAASLFLGYIFFKKDDIH